MILKIQLNFFGLQKNFDFLSSLYLKNKLPKVLMFSGSKGTGKSTLINHFFFSIFDKKNYDKTNFIFNRKYQIYIKNLKIIYFQILYI